jgi:hypothetical protein
VCTPVALAQVNAKKNVAAFSIGIENGKENSVF